MYLLAGNTTASMSSPPVGNYVMWSGRLRSARYNGWNPAEWVEIKSGYVITRGTLEHKSIYNHLTRTATVDEIINVNRSKAPQKANN